MVMKNTKQCKTCVYGVKWDYFWTCGRCFESDGTINKDRIPNRTDKQCFDFVKKSKCEFRKGYKNGY